MVRQNPRCKEYCLKLTKIATPGRSRKRCGIASLKIFPNMNALQLNVIAPCACGIRIVTLCNRPSGFLPFTHRKFSPPLGQLVKFLILVGQFVASWRYHFYIRSIYHSFCACLKKAKQRPQLTKRSNLLEKSLFFPKTRWEHRCHWSVTEGC